jgi:hypothetical protein
MTTTTIGGLELLKKHAEIAQPKDKKEDTKHHVEVGADDPLYEFVNAHKESKALKGQAQALEALAKHLYPEARRIVDEEHWGEAEAPKQLVFITDKHEATINVMAGGYKTLDPQGGEAVKGIVGDDFYGTHLGEHVVASVNLSKVSKDKLDAVCAHLMQTNETAGADVVDIKVTVKAKETFHNAKRTELDPIQISELDDAGLQTRVQFAATKNA